MWAISPSQISNKIDMCYFLCSKMDIKIKYL